MSEWISVKERLPAVGQIVQVVLIVSALPNTGKESQREIIYASLEALYIPNSHMGRYYYWHSRTANIELRDVEWSKITHWMPLPELPKEEE